MHMVLKHSFAFLPAVFLAGLFIASFNSSTSSEETSAKAASSDPLPFWTGNPPAGITRPYAQNGNNDTFKDILTGINAPRECAYKSASIEFTIGTDGAVSDWVLLQSSGVGEIDEALKTDIAKLHYTPVTKNGEPIAVRDRFALHAKPNDDRKKLCEIIPSTK